VDKEKGGQGESSPLSLSPCPLVPLSPGLRWLRGYSESELKSVLKLERIRGVARRLESEDRIRLRAECRRSVDSVQVGDVDAVEKVEEVAAEFGADAFIEADFAGDAQVEAGEPRPFDGVPAQIARAVGERIAVAIRVRAGEDVEPPSGLSRQQRAELEIAQEVYARGNLADESQREPVRHSLARDGALRPDARPFGQVGQVGHRFRVVDGLRERIAPVKTEPAREPLLELESPAVMVGESDVIVYVEIGVLGEYSCVVRW